MTAGAVAAPRIIPIMQGSKATSKNHIDTNTLVCIQSDTGQARLLYTLDGSRPARQAPSASGSGGRRYLSPFLLPSGRVCVRAVAATSDGRESATVTKVFVVREVEPLQQEAIPGQGLRDDVATWRRPQGSKVTGGASGPCVAPPAGVSARSGWSVTSPSGGAPDTHAHFPRRAQRLPFFCPMCGTLAPHTMAPAGGGQLLCCVWCHTQVPVNAHVCSRGHDPGQQKIRRSLQAHIMCVCCGRGNPADLSHCLTCDTRLHATALEVESAPCVQEDSHKANLSCSACRRVNRGDARFCDWCGTKKTVGCVFRGASVAPRAASCDVCGRSPEAAPGSRADATVSTSRAGPPTAERHAQTLGTHWPSGTGRPRAPRAAVSPGRGYWRKQLDHVCAHLRSFAHNDAPFRTLLGEPRLGRMTSAVLQENGREVILTLGFAAAAAAAEDVRHKVGEKVAGEAARETVAAPKTPPGSGSKASGAEMSKDVQLLQELGQGPGSSRVGVVQRLLDQGADPNCQGGGDYDARPAAAIATINGHHAVLPLLLQRGADMDRQSGLKKNTALHEAAARGPEGLGCAQVLLSCNAATGVRNADGLTAYDVAVTGGYADMMSLLDGSASLGGAELTPGSTLRNSSRVVV